DDLHGLIELLKREETHWIDTDEAELLLAPGKRGFMSYWATHGLVRGRTSADGRSEVAFEDVLWQREAEEGLTAIDEDHEWTQEELMRALGKLPKQRKAKRRNVDAPSERTLEPTSGGAR